MPRPPTTESNQAAILHGVEVQAGYFATLRANLSSQDQRVKRIEDDFAGVYRRLDDMSASFSRALDEQNKTAAAQNVRTTEAIQAVSSSVQTLATTVTSRSGTVNLGATMAVVVPVVMFLGIIAAMFIRPLSLQIDQLEAARAQDESNGGTAGARIQFGQVREELETQGKTLDKVVLQANANTDSLAQQQVVVAGLQTQFGVINQQRFWDSQKADLKAIADEMVDRMKAKTPPQ